MPAPADKEIVRLEAAPAATVPPAALALNHEELLARLQLTGAALALVREKGCAVTLNGPPAGPTAANPLSGNASSGGDSVKLAPQTLPLDAP